MISLGTLLLIPRLLATAMSQIVAMLLLHIPNEELAFWCLVRLFYSPPWSHREFFIASDEFALLKDCCSALEALIRQRLPRLWQHLADRGLDDAVLFATPWFLTLFSYRYPLGFAVHAWELYLAEGLPALFRVGLALLQEQQTELLGMQGEDRLLPALTSTPRQLDTAGECHLSLAPPHTLQPFKVPCPISAR